MPTNPDDALKKAARAVTDGSPVDWESLSASNPALRSKLDKLRLIESLAASARGAGDPLDRNVPPTPEFQFSWGGLQVLEKIGEGSFGEVYRAFDPILQREVALKLHRPGTDGADSEFAPHIEEARKLARVRHPNVLAVHGVEVHDGRAGMWTDFIRGSTLEERIGTGEPLGAEEIAWIARELCRALSAVHAVRIVHGDIKAANVMRDTDGRIILMDFGAGSYVPQTARGLNGSQHGVPAGFGPSSSGRRLIGTPLVMAPELLDGVEPNVRTDLYALGVLLFRLATGRHPIEASTAEELVRLHLEGERIPLREIRPDLPDLFARSIERALSPDPEDRYADALEMESKLIAALGADPERTGAGESRGVRNRPRYPTRFIGREKELASVRRLIVESPFITLTGPGGAGKTRLAARVADEMAGGFPGGVCFASLAHMTPDSPLDAEIGRALGIREEPSSPLRETLVEKLAGVRSLLVLDNCEQILDPVRGFVAFLRSSCPGVQLIVTSRQALGLTGECVFAMPPMRLPRAADGGQSAGLEISDAEAVRLFLDRAVRSRPDFSLSASNAPHIASICRRLEGYPLAIELAAARVRALGTETIAARLDESFRILTSGDTETSRHSTIEASIDWSYRLLSASEQRLFHRLGVFAGPWPIEAAEAICADDPRNPGELDSEPILDLLSGLVEKSLVDFETPVEDHGTPGDGAAPGPPAYRMPEMIRQYASAALEQSDEAGVLRSRHLAYYHRFTEEIRHRIYEAEQDRLLQWVESQQDNYRAAIRWSMDPDGDIDAGLRIATIIRRFWFVRGYATEGRRILHELIATGRGAPRNRASAIISASGLAWASGDSVVSERLALQGLRILEEAGEIDGRIPALAMLGTIASDEGNYPKARGLLEEALELRRQVPEASSLASILCNLGVLCARQGDLRAAGLYYEEAYAAMVGQGDFASAATVLMNFSATARDLGDLSRAKELAQESIRIFRSSENRRGLPSAIMNLATVFQAEGDLKRTRELLLESLAGARAHEDRREIVDILEGVAQLWSLDGRFHAAAVLFGAADALREAVRQSLHPLGQAAHDAAVDRTRRALGEGRFVAAHARGRSMDFARAIEHAIDPGDELCS
jgi:predicted ATPase